MPSRLTTSEVRPLSRTSSVRALRSSRQTCGSARTDARLPPTAQGPATAIKVVSVPKPSCSIPGLPATTLLFDESSGLTRACVNAAELTGIRTACVPLSLFPAAMAQADEDAAPAVPPRPSRPSSSPTRRPPRSSSLAPGPRPTTTLARLSLSLSLSQSRCQLETDVNAASQASSCSSSPRSPRPLSSFAQSRLERKRSLTAFRPSSTRLPCELVPARTRTRPSRAPTSSARASARLSHAQASQDRS